MRFLPDLLGLIGFGALMAGLIMVAGLGWALVIGGALMISAAVVGEWKRNRG